MLPTIVFVHGAWHSPEFFHKVIPKLEAVGYKTVAVSMAAIRSPPVTSLDEDIEVVRSAVMKELDAGNDVVVHAHSWGGIPTNSALDGLSKEERQGKSAVLKLTFATSFVLSEGVSLQESVGGQPPPWATIHDNGYIIPDTPIATFYHDADPAEAEEWSKKLRPQSYATFTDKTRSAAWKKIPVAYLVCEDDAAIPAQGQEAMAAGIEEAGQEVVIERIKSAHSPHLTQPDAVVAFIRRAVE